MHEATAGINHGLGQHGWQPVSGCGIGVFSVTEKTNFICTRKSRTEGDLRLSQITEAASSK